MSRLEQWAVVRAQISPYMAPEQPLQCLQGILSDHGRMPDGSDVTTSPIIGKRLVDLGIGEQGYIEICGFFCLGIKPKAWDDGT